MRRTIVAVGLVLAGCGAPAVNDGGAAAYAQTRAQQRAQYDVQTSAALKESTDRTTAQLEATRAQMVADQAARDSALSSALEQGRATRQAQEDARAKAAEESCVKTRSERGADAQLHVRSYTEWLSRVAPRGKAIIAACKITLTNTGAVDVQHNSGGLRVSPVQKAGVACKGGVPKGLSEQDVYVLLARLQPGALDGSDIPLAEESTFAQANRACAEGDRAAGLDTSVAEKDTDGIKRLLAWKPATP